MELHVLDLIIYFFLLFILDRILTEWYFMYDRIEFESVVAYICYTVVYIIIFFVIDVNVSDIFNLKLYDIIPENLTLTW